MWFGKWSIWLSLVTFALTQQQQLQPPPPSPPSPQQQQLGSSEAYAMRHLRYDLRIRNFYWPKARDPCLSWRGVLCENGQVVSIYLTGLKRTVAGMARPTLELGNLRGLSSLRLLNATGFQMIGTIPEWIGQLNALEVLDFSSCSISGPIPDGVGQLDNLRRLSLARNNLTGSVPVAIGSLSRLEFVDMSNNMLTGGIPREVGGLSVLKELDLSDNIISGLIPDDLGRLTRLERLKLSENRLEGSIPESVTRLSGLRELALASNMLESVLPPLGALRNLTVLNLAFNNFTGVLSPAGLERLASIQNLNLSGNTLYGPVLVLSMSRRLPVLDVSSNYFNGTVPRDILPQAVVDRNCFLNSTGQRSLSECQAFYAARGLVFENTTSLNKPTPMLKGKSRSNRRLIIILCATLGGVLAILVIAALGVFIRKREKRTVTSKQQEEVVVQTPASGPSSQPVPSMSISVKMSSIGESFTFIQVQRATQDFSPSNLIKAGHSGDLYRGFLDGGVAVVVKRIEVAKMQKDLLSEELDVFSKASHTRLVPLLGHCLELDELKFLVYKYMPNGDLGQALHKKVVPSPPADILQSLDWITRLKIAIGAAEGLNYLHHECFPPLVHRDIQASSILLDDKFEVRLGSLSETRTQEGEAQPRLITRLLRLSQATEQGEPGAAVASCSYDVYCFGKVLLELVTGKLDISSSLDPNADAWLEWALQLIDRHNKEGIMKLVDPSLIVDEDLLEEVWAMAIVAKLCLNTRPSKRPQIRHVLKALENPQRVTREENYSSSLRSRTSSHSSWNASLFGSWRHSSSENVITPGMLREEYVVDPNRKHSGTSHSQTGSITGEQSFHRRPGSNEIFPEPAEDVIKSASLGSGDNGNSNRQQQQQPQQQTA